MMNFYILAGGRSLRMGKNKALLKVDGQTVIEKIIAAIPTKVENIKIVANRPETYRFLHLDIIPDRIRDLGPISGVHAGLTDSSTHFNFFLPCDVPMISTEVIQLLLEKHAGQDLFGFKSPQGIEPLCAIYSRNCLPVIEEQIERKQYSLYQLADAVSSKFIDVKRAELLFNMNTLADWNRIKRRGLS